MSSKYGISNDSEKEKTYNFAVKKGLKYAAVFTAGSLVASYIAQKRSPFYRSLSPAVKASLVCSTALVAFWIPADRSMMELENLRGEKRVQKMLEKTGTSTDTPVIKKHEESEPWKTTLLRRRYEIVGGMWLGTIAATIGYLWLKPIPTSQKLLNARLTSQTLAILGAAGFAAAAALSSEAPAPKSLDPHFDAIVYGVQSSQENASPQH